MESKTIKILSNIVLLKENFINEIFAKPYIVINDISELKDGQQPSDPLLIQTYQLIKHHSSTNVRNIYFPISQQLNATFKGIAKWLASQYTNPNSVHGFVKKRGIKTNAEQHLGCNHLLKLDLENFYEQISEESIIEALIAIGIDSELSILISKICTVKGSLVQGFSTSPVISNIISLKLDQELEKYANSNNIVYTRYADDMSFSSMTVIPNKDEIEKIINDFNFVLNKDKTKYLKRGFYQSVTGLTIFDTIQPRIPKRIKRNLRLEVHYINRFGMKNHAIRRLAKKGKANMNPNFEEDLRKEIITSRLRIIGWINFSNGIEKQFSSKLASMFNSRV